MENHLREEIPFGEILRKSLLAMPEDQVRAGRTERLVVMPSQWYLHRVVFSALLELVRPACESTNAWVRGRIVCFYAPTRFGFLGGCAAWAMGGCVVLLR